MLVCYSKKYKTKFRMKILKNIFKNSRSSSEDGIFFTEIEKVIGFKPQSIQYYQKAFTHRSTNRTDLKGNPMNYERLEFLGDAMLSAVIAAYLYNEAPAGDEGYLTKMRSKIVNRANLNQLARKMGFDQLIVFDQKTVSVQSKHHSMLGDAFEALIGAVYLDKGYDFTRNFLLKRIVKPYIDVHTLEMTETNFKSKLIENK